MNMKMKRWKKTNRYPNIMYGFMTLCLDFFKQPYALEIASLKTLSRENPMKTKTWSRKKKFSAY
jgi:hypothetical protein